MYRSADEPANLPGWLQGPRSVSVESEGLSAAGSANTATARACPLAQTPQRRLLMSAFEAWRYARVSSGLHIFFALSCVTLVLCLKLTLIRTEITLQK